MDRETLIYATCAQLVGLIADDWDEETRPPEVEAALTLLKQFKEDPEDMGLIRNDGNLVSSDLPVSVIRGQRITYIAVALACCMAFMQHGDGWQTKDSGDLKKEITSRIRYYEKKLNELKNPAHPAECRITG